MTIDPPRHQMTEPDRDRRADDRDNCLATISRVDHQMQALARNYDPLCEDVLECVILLEAVAKEARRAIQ